MFRFLLSIALFFTPSFVLAQNITVTGPNNDLVYGEGDEFSTDEMQNAWDFNQRRDIGWEENISETSISVNGGVWRGTNSAGAAYVFPLFPGFINTLETEPVPGDKETPTLGATNRIDASKYSHVSYKLNNTNRSSFSIYWEGDPNKSQYWPDPSSPYYAAADGYYHARGFTPHHDYNIYSINMKTLAGADHSRGPWAGDLYAFRIDPSNAAGAGAVTELDWLRISDPDSAPDYTVTWNASGLNDTTVTTIWMDTDASGYNGTPIARYAYGQNPGSHTFPTAMLPPGNYNFYVSVQNNLGNGFGPIRYSAYTARLTIKAKADVSILSPSYDSGEDYAETVVGNPWDFNSPIDVPNMDNSGEFRDDVWRQFSNPSFNFDLSAVEGGTLFSASADAPLPGNTESDVQLHLNIPDNNPIDVNKYRYVTYRMWIDSGNYTTIADKVFRGWVSRPFTYWNDSRELSSFTAGYIKGHVIYEGWHTYTIDMWSDRILETGTLFQDYGVIKNARLEPGEFDVDTNFKVDYLKLTAENATTNNQYQIKYNIADIDSSSFNVELYYDTDNSGFNGVFIDRNASANLGINTFNWDTSNLPDGKYYIYLLVNDGVATSRRYSSVQINVGDQLAPPVARSAKVLQDFDGDGRTDLTLYRGQFGYPGFLTSKSTGGIREVNWGGAGFIPIHGDFDNDGRSDYALLEDTGVATHAYWYHSSDDSLHYTTFPFSGGRPAVEDYNGDGNEQIALYNISTGQWHITNGGGAPLTDIEVRSWGLPGDLSVPADYDGDGKAELAVFRPSSGNWIYLQTSDGQYRQVQWGIGQYEDVPMPGDYDNDGKADFAVFRYGSQRKSSPNSRLRNYDFGSGGWYVKTSVSDQILSFWGTPGTNNEAHVPVNGDTPVLGDVNGDGTLDVMMFRRHTGQWFIDFRNGVGLQTFNTGLPGDRIPRRIK